MLPRTFTILSAPRLTGCTIVRIHTSDYMFNYLCNRNYLGTYMLISTDTQMFVTYPAVLFTPTGMWLRLETIQHTFASCAVVKTYDTAANDVPLYWHTCM
jgi:hypothetical protein